MGERKRDTSGEPWIANYPPLQQWITKMIEERRAFCQWQRKQPGGAYLECWQIGAAQILIMVEPRRCGWSIFTQPDGNEIESYLAEVEARIGAVAAAGQGAGHG